MASARNHWSHDQLREDARYQRGVEFELRLRARTEFDPSNTLRAANTAKLRAEASENILLHRDMCTRSTGQ